MSDRRILPEPGEPEVGCCYREARFEGVEDYRTFVDKALEALTLRDARTLLERCELAYYRTDDEALETMYGTRAAWWIRRLRDG